MVNFVQSIETIAQAEALLNLPEADLFASATRLREAAFGRGISLCAIINARSGNCCMDCRFCSQSRHNPTFVAVFDLLPDDILRERILALAALPVSRIGIVTAGAALCSDELHRLCALVRSLPDAVRARVCASLGRLSGVQFAALRDAGLTRYHHNLETSQAYYPSVCTTQTWKQRHDCVQLAHDTGFSVCSGGLFGLGESWADRIAFAFSLKAMHVRFVPINFLHPHSQTPLAAQPPLHAGEALRIIALLRHILPQAVLRVCGGRPLALGARQHEMFAAGADALMTGDYLTTHGQGIDDDLAMLAALDLEPRI